MGDILQPPGHPISYFPKLSRVTGSVKAAILAQQISYWTPRAHDAEGWIYKSQTAWMDETGFTLKEFRGACQELESRKLIIKDYDRMNHELRIQLQIDAYNLALQGIKENRAPAKRAHAKKAHAKKAHAKREGGIYQKGTWHVPKGHFDIDEAETTTEITTEKEDTPPISPSPADADEVTNADSPAGKFVAWWNEHIVPLGGRPFSLEDADAKFIIKANKALKDKSGAAFWSRVKQGFEASGFLRGEVTPAPGKKRFKATLPWLLSLHHSKGMANYALVASAEWNDDPEATYERKAISHDEVEL